MRFIPGQLIIILAPFLEHEIYANLKQFDENTLVLEMKMNNKIPTNKDILCIAVAESKMFEFFTQVDVSQGNLLFIKRPKVGQLNVIEKRNFNRVDCNIGFLATLVSIDNKPLSNMDKKFTGTILNISGGGILVETKLNLPVDLVFSFKLKLNFSIDCKARVVRTGATTKEGAYLLGCQFEDLSLESIKAISFYAFKQQLEKKRMNFKN